jgi:7-cyano-7-deazaguanine synthase in queuosine biosynthesis
VIVETSQDTIDLSFDSKATNILVKVSGGLDSAIVLYMLCEYASNERPDLNIIVMTANDWKKPYQVAFAEKIINWHRSKFPLVNILEHETSQLEHGSDYIKGQQDLKDKVMEKYDIHISCNGINALPPKDVLPFRNNKNIVQDGPVDDRYGRSDQWDLGKKRFSMLRNLDKKGVAELYTKFNLHDSLKNVTRSCESSNAEKTNNFTTHCGHCWWCSERKWGFGTL